MNPKSGKILLFSILFTVLFLRACVRQRPVQTLRTAQERRYHRPFHAAGTHPPLLVPVFIQ